MINEDEDKWNDMEQLRETEIQGTNMKNDEIRILKNEIR